MKVCDGPKAHNSRVQVHDCIGGRDDDDLFDFLEDKHHERCKTQKIILELSCFAELD